MISWPQPSPPLPNDMKVVVKVTHSELAEMGASEDRLQRAVRNALTSGLDDGDGTLYINDLEVDIDISGLG